MDSIICPQCRNYFRTSASRVNRAAVIQAPLYCGRECSGKARRSGKSIEEKKEEKRIYDMQYRLDNAESLRVKKHDWFQRSYDPQAEAEKRKERMPRHLEYCRSDRYRRYKEAYDRIRRAKKAAGEFWECYTILLELDKQLDIQQPRDQRYVAKGYYNKSQQRRRNYEKLTAR